MGAYYHPLTGNDEEVEIRYTCAWCKWELSILRLLIDEEVLALFEIDHFILALAHIEWCIKFSPS
ncbi:hypothetical protein TrispH2_012088 [Trichoplax sp. H2]|nr:hypothetical protein TrispH2_012088 [Trichoplax sp. H2]|eukprot:RDD35847.1 hypothetical protein TrispH2_012088 [Trichoplax sp. H2]